MSSQGTGSVVDFDLPDEILSVIPTDPYQQLDLARKITSMAIASRVSSLESDASRLRQKLLEKDRIILDLEDRLSSLTRASHQTDSTLNTALNENIKLSKERDQLAATVKKLSRDFAKVTSFLFIYLVQNYFRLLESLPMFYIFARHWNVVINH